jgi:hypothetical protein
MKECNFKVIDNISGKGRKAELKKVVKGYSYCGMRNDEVTHVFERGNIKVLIRISENDISFSKEQNQEAVEFNYDYVHKFFNLIPMND